MEEKYNAPKIVRWANIWGAQTTGRHSRYIDSQSIPDTGETAGGQLFGGGKFRIESQALIPHAISPGAAAQVACEMLETLSICAVSISKAVSEPPIGD